MVADHVRAGRAAGTPETTRRGNAVEYRPLEDIAGRIERKRVPFSDLMPWRVRRILLVSSLYDSFTFQEDGNLGEMLFTEYQELNLSSAPTIIRVSTAGEAIETVAETNPDIVITMPRVGDIDVFEFGRRVKEIIPGLPVVLLAYDTRELPLLKERDDGTSIDRMFVWLGDARVFLAIIKSIEDRTNHAHDAELAGVKSIVLVEDSVRFYSAYLPMLYGEIVEQTQALMVEGVNRMQQLMRMRARPKVLLASTYEEGVKLLEDCREHLLGVIADARFRKDGAPDATAGIDFARAIQKAAPGTPVLIQSTDPSTAGVAEAIGAAFIEKNSPMLLSDVRGFMREHLGFGDFVFRTTDGDEVMRAGGLRGLLDAIKEVSEESLMYHAARNDFSTWLMARTEFDLAKALRPRAVSDFTSPAELRDYLLESVREYRSQSRAGLVETFSENTFEPETAFTRIGSGSLGGKGRGLAFANSLLNAYEIEDRIEGVHILVPPTAVVATDVFDTFMDQSNLVDLALHGTDDREIRAAFLAAALPAATRGELREFLKRVRYPIAVRSSSLFEDSSFQPFAGIYETYMLPNADEDLEVRLDQLCRAIRLVYASTYSADSKSYIESTPNRLEEEKMAVVIQQVAGRRHGDYLYPNFSGVARSYDFYPVKGMESDDGVASVALGLGRTVVEGGRCVRFAPAKPRRLFQFSTVTDYLKNSQNEFYALDLASPPPGRTERDVSETNLALLGIDVAEEHGTLDAVGSVYDAGSERIYDGIGRPGVRLVTMAGALSGDWFPLPDALRFLLEVGKSGFTCHVEIEFAVNLLDRKDDGRHELAFLQIRPLVFGVEAEAVEMGEIETTGAIAVSGNALGHGLIEGVRDVVFVRPSTFSRSKTAAIATEVGTMNGRLREEDRPYLLVGPGRWGSADEWLGIPVRWSQISGARCIVESEMEGIDIEPSQGTHFFQNITSFGIGYFTIRSSDPRSHLDEAWLESQDVAFETEHVRHVRFEEPLEIVINSKSGIGAIMKPGIHVVPEA